MRSKAENVSLLGILFGFGILSVGGGVHILFRQASWIDYTGFGVLAFSIILMAIHEVLTRNATFFGITIKAAIQNIPIKAIEMPSRPADRKRWRETWQVIKPRWSTGKETYADMIVFLQIHHNQLACIDDTLRKIIAAGEAGLLD